MTKKYFCKNIGCGKELLKGENYKRKTVIYEGNTIYFKNLQIGDKVCDKCYHTSYKKFQELPKNNEPDLEKLSLVLF